jgi:hypothetical protein
MALLKKPRRVLLLAIVAFLIGATTQVQASDLGTSLTHGAKQDPRLEASPEAPPITHYSLPPEKEREAVDLARTGRRIFWGEFFTEVIVLLLLLRSGWAARFRDWAERVSCHRIVQAAISFHAQCCEPSGPNLGARARKELRALRTGLEFLGA